MDLWQVGLGFFIGLVATLMMIEFGFRKVWPWRERSRLTSIWDLRDVKGREPLLICAERIKNVEIPKGSMLVTKEPMSGARVNPNIETNFVVGEDKALIFSSHIHPNAFVIWSTNPKIIKRLSAEFNRLWHGS